MSHKTAIPTESEPVSKQWRCVEADGPRTGWKHMELDGHDVWQAYAKRNDNTAVIEYRNLYATPYAPQASEPTAQDILAFAGDYRPAVDRPVEEIVDSCLRVWFSTPDPDTVDPAYRIVMTEIVKLVRDIEHERCNRIVKDAWDCNINIEEIATAVDVSRLREALKPFSDFAGELFARNFNASDSVDTIMKPGYGSVSIYGKDFFAARAVLTASEVQR